MKKRLLSTFLSLCMVLTMVPTMAFAAGEPDVVYGSYTDGTWSQTGGDGSSTDPVTGVTVSKTAQKVASKDNQYQVTLKVETSTKTTVNPAGAAATVLVIDTSGSMDYCAECGGNGSHTRSCRYYDSRWWENDVEPSQSRMYAAKRAANDFINTYGGDTSDAQRYLAIVKFADDGSTVQSWVDVSTDEGKQRAKSIIDDLSAYGGTNLDEGLARASDLLNSETVSSIAKAQKNVVVLTDGQPTHSESITNGYFCTWNILNDTTQTATSLKQEAQIYTVCFGVSDDECYWGGPKVGAFLRDSIATTADAEHKYAYDADNTDELNAAFEAISDSITTGMSGADFVVNDPMGPGVTLVNGVPAGTTATEDGFEWELSNPTERVAGGVTYYTYTLTYTVSIDPTQIEGFSEDAYYPLNKATTLTIPAQEEDGDPNVIQFPVPGVHAVAPVYTVTYNKGDHGTLAGENEQGNVVHENVKYGSATPEAPTVTAEDGWYFTGWAPTIANTVTKDVTYTAQYATQTVVTVTANSASVEYDGKQKKVSGVAHTDLPDGYMLDCTATATGTDVGEYPVNVGTVTIHDSQGKDVTSQFRIIKINGTLTIEPISITIQADSNSKIYDGTPLTDNGYSIVTGSVAQHQRIDSVIVTGRQTDVGSSANKPSDAKIVDASGTDVTSNYKITYVDGTLTVTKDTNATIEATGYSDIYDGADHDGVTNVTLKDSKGQTLNKEDWTITYTYSGNPSNTIPQFKDAGTYQVKVTAKNDNYKELSTTVTVQIGKRSVTLTSPDQIKEYDGTALVGDLEQFTQEGFVPGEGVTFTNPASITNVEESPATNTITYDWNSNTKESNYNVTKKEGKLTIKANDDENVSLKATAYNGVYDGNAHDLVTKTEITGAVDGTNWTYQYSLTGADGAWSNEIPSKTDAAAYPVWVKASNPNYTDKIVQVEANITPKPVTLTSGSESRTYDGTPLKKETVTADGFVKDEGATYSNFASITNVGTQQNTFEYTLNSNTKETNYKIEKKFGTLTITKSNNATLQVDGYTGTYDGDAHTVTERITGAVEGTVWTYQYSTTGADGPWDNTKPVYKDAGTYTVYVQATNSNYETLTGKATVTISPVQITLTSATATKAYDGTPLTANQVTPSRAFIGDEGVTCTVTGTQTVVGSSKNEFTYDFNEGTNHQNYEIKQVFGTLTVTPNQGEDASIVAVPYTGMYDGQAHNALTSYEVSGVKIQDVEWQYWFSTDNGENYSTEMPQYTDVGEYPVIVKASNKNFEDITTKVTAEIWKRNVVLTSGTSSRTYDGNPLTNLTVTVTGDGFAQNEGATYSNFASITNVGTQQNTFDYALNSNTKADNYNIKQEYGTLTITKNSGKDDEGEQVVNLTAEGYTGKYDGIQHDGVSNETVTGAVDGTQWTYTYSTDGSTYGTAKPQFKDAGTYTVYVKASNQNYEDLTTTVPVVISKREITLTSATDEKQYDGTPLTNDQITVDGDGFVTGEGATYNVTGTQTVIGSSKNTFTYKLNDNTLAQNYTIDTTEGTLTVTPNEAKITIAPADIVIYTGGDGYGGVTDGNGDIIAVTQSSGLPEPGYHITLSDDLRALLGNESTAADLANYLKFTYNVGSDNREWALHYVGVYATDTDGNPTQYVYSLAPATVGEKQIPVRLAYKDGDTIITDDQITMGEDVVNKDYTMTINPGDLDQNQIKAQLTVGGQTITCDVEVGTGTLTVKSVADKDENGQPTINAIADSEDAVDNNIITAVDNGVTYFVNNSEVEVENENDRVQLLVDEVSNNEGYNDAMGEDAIDKVQADAAYADNLTNPAYDSAYLDLVDTKNGNAVVTMGDTVNDKLTIYWPVPADAESDSAFYVVHYSGMNRSEQTVAGADGLQTASTEIQAAQTTEIDGKKFVTFEASSFSPYVLVYSGTHTVTFNEGANGSLAGDDDNDGNVIVSNIADGSKLTNEQIPAVTADSDYSFTGWKMSGDTDPNKLYSSADIAAMEITDDLTFTAQYTFNGGGGGGGTTTRYTLTYESNGGTEYDSERYTRNTVVDLDKVPSREGYTFTGWYADAELTEQISEIKMTSNKTVYAGWEVTGVPDWLNGDDHFAYVIGYSDGTVKPLNNISRAEVATIFFRLLKPEIRDEYLTQTSQFTDVSADAWYNTAVSTMAALGIVNGRTADTFAPDASITRAEFAAICARFDTNKRDGDSNFSDIAGHWAEAEIERAATLGWINGYSDGTFHPDNAITRAEAMTMINRVLQRLPETEDDLLDDMNVWPDNQPSAWYYLAVQEATNSHDFDRKDDGVHETWTSRNTDPDWMQYQ